MKNIEYFPNLLRDLMLEKGISVTQLASKVGKTPQYVYQWFIGQVVPDPTSVLKISKAIGGYDLELFESSLALSHSRKQNKIGNYIDKRDFDLRNSLEEIIHNARVPEAVLPEIIKLWNQADVYSRKYNDTVFEEDSEHNLIILPDPPIIFLENWRELVQKIAKDGKELYKLHWKKFEDLIAHLLEKFGWIVSPMGYTKDDGIDVIAAKIVQPDINFQMLVQCKKYSKSRKVGVELVREVWAVKWEKGFHQAMIATTSSFTTGAKKKAEKWNLELRDHDSIISWCENYGNTIF